MRFWSILLVILIAFSYCQDFNETSEEEFDKLSTIKYQCSFFDHWSIFSYKPIENKISDEDFSAPITDSGVSNKRIYFSFCNDCDIECVNKPDQIGSALLRDETTKECTRVSSDKWTDVRVVYVENELDKTRDYLRLIWENGDECPYGTEGWEYSIDVVCSDVDIDDSRFFYTGGYEDGSCRIRTQFESKIGWAIISYRGLTDFIDKNRIVFGVILIVLGACLTVLGYRLILVSLFIAGVLATVGAAGIVAYQFFITKDTPDYAIWITLGVALVVGCLVGYALVRLRKIGVFILSILGGVWLGLILNNAVIRYTQSKVLLWVAIGAWGLLCGILSCFLYVIVAIASTSLIGAYALVRGISVFVGHFPDEVTIVEQIKNGTAPKTDWHFWVYLAGILVLFIIGFYIQWRFRPERKGKKGKKKNGEYFRLDQ